MQDAVEDDIGSRSHGVERNRSDAEMMNITIFQKKLTAEFYVGYYPTT